MITDRVRFAILFYVLTMFTLYLAPNSSRLMTDFGVRKTESLITLSSISIAAAVGLTFLFTWLDCVCA